MHLILLYSGNPLPAMLEIGFVAEARNIDVDLILVDRNQADLAVDHELINYPVTRITSPYNGLNIRRMLSFPLVFFRIANALRAKSRNPSIVITSTFDMLFIARIAAVFTPIRLRHQVRDLHALQLGRGLMSGVLRTVEKWLLKRCELLIYSAPSFYEDYYYSIYRGQHVLLENLPGKDVWKNFSRRDLKVGEFRIGYIGIIRYMNPLINLVKAIDSIEQSEISYNVLFAGGGNSDEIKKHVRSKELFSFIGKFEYTTEVANLHDDVDLIYAVYDRFDRNCQLAMPTKFYEALITKIPIMVSKGTYVGDLVERIGIGIAVDGECPDSLVMALQTVNCEDSWYMRARARLQSLDIQRWYESYDTALETVIAEEIDN
jgi:glycosyltransferase involved in cell wall biosynthesis